MMTQRKTRSSSSSRNGEENSEPIPSDLIIEILTRLPVKSIARFCCLSKLWYSTLRSPIFTDSFLTISSSHPKLLFTCLKEGETFFFTSQQPHNSSTLTASFHMKFPINYSFDICQPVGGLICGKNQRTIEGKTITVPLICNPSTGESLALPRVKSSRKNVVSYFGYDPVHKQYKVLCMTQSDHGCGSSEEHQVLTLVTGKKLSWRMIKCDIPHDLVPMETITAASCAYGRYDCIMICINGVLYYIARVHDGGEFWRPDIVCFDIRSEKFNCIRRGDGMHNHFLAEPKWTLVNYKGKLAMLQSNIAEKKCIGIKLYVLEDAENREWSTYIYVFPLPWKNIVAETVLCFVGMTSTGEIVLRPKYVSDPFYLLYYNPEKNNITKFEIQGMEAFRFLTAYIFLDHVENVMHMASVWNRGQLT